MDVKHMIELASCRAGFTGRIRMEFDRLLAERPDGVWQEWNPLEDGNDTLDLAVRNSLFTTHHGRFHQLYMNYREEGHDLNEAVRLAIVHSVAELEEKKA